MQDNYIIRQSNNRLICFYNSSENSIIYKTYENNRWSPVKELIANTLKKFTVTLSHNGTLYVFCQSIDGDIILCTSDKTLNNWSNKVILKNKSNKKHTVLFYPIIKSSGLCIIYNLPLDDEGPKLVLQNLDESGKWTTPYPIDNFSPFKGNMFEVQNISNEHLIIFYQSKRTENNIGYREVTSDKCSNFKPIHLTSYQIMDTSFVTTNDTIHALYIVKSMFSYQILYRKKLIDGFSNPIVIWEGQKIENCLLSIINNTIVASFKYRGQIFMSFSKNQGETFTRPDIYRNKLCINPKKCIYISEPPMNEKDFYVREIYVDSNNPWDIQILPEMYENFYPTDVKIQDTPKKTINPEVNSEETQVEMKNIYNMQLSIKKLEKLIIEKDEQILYMTNIINRYKSEKEDEDYEKTNIEKKYTREIQLLNNKISELIDINEDLNNKLNKLQSTHITENTETVNNIEATTTETDDRIITIQSNSPSVLIPYKR